MGNVKLTLSADKALIARAKRFARRHRTSLSAMFRSYMETVLAHADGDLDVDSLPPNTRKALGTVKLPPGKDYKDLLEEAILEKHGLTR